MDEQEDENYQGKCRKHVRNMQHGATLEDKWGECDYIYIICKFVIIVLYYYRV